MLGGCQGKLPNPIPRISRDANLKDRATGSQPLF